MTEQALSRRQQKTRLVFMNALVRLIVQKGLDQITVTDIANEANYGRWAFYQYFESKEDVAWATFVHWMTQLDAHLIERTQRLEAPQREYESWRIIFRAFYDQREFFTKLDSVMVSKWRQRAKEFLVRQFTQHLYAGRFALMPGVRPEVAARLYVAAIMELLDYWSHHPELGDADALADEFFVFIFNQAPPAPQK